jgi:hypothetical protein
MPNLSSTAPSFEAFRSSLPPKIAAGLRSGGELARALAFARSEGPVPTGVDAVDRLLGGGIPRGRLVELAGRGSGGRFAVVLSTLASATSAGEAVALVDLGDGFDPRGGEQAGVDLPRLLWIRPRRLKPALVATELAVGAGFPLVVLDLGLPPLRGFVPASAWIRLARSAETHECALLLSTPWPRAGAGAAFALRVDGRGGSWLGEREGLRVLAGLGARLAAGKGCLTTGISPRIVLRTPGTVAPPGSESGDGNETKSDGRRGPTRSEPLRLATSR